MRNMVGPTPSDGGDLAEFRSMVQNSFMMETCTTVNKRRDFKIRKRPHSLKVEIARRGYIWSWFVSQFKDAREIK